MVALSTMRRRVNRMKHEDGVQDDEFVSAVDYLLRLSNGFGSSLLRTNKSGLPRTFLDSPPSRTTLADAAACRRCAGFAWPARLASEPRVPYDASILQCTRPSGFVEPCLPSPAERPPVGPLQHPPFRPAPVRSRRTTCPCGEIFLTSRASTWIARPSDSRWPMKGVSSCEERSAMLLCGNARYVTR
jgi:hypothetical protein